MRILADLALQGRRNMIAGANRDDYHLRNVTPGEDFQAEFFDLRQVAAGRYVCVEYRRSARDRKIGRDRAHLQARLQVFRVDGPAVLNDDGEEVTVIMGSYGIGIERILCAAIELYHDKDGMSLPASIAPFEVVITPVNYTDAAQRSRSRTNLSASAGAQASTRFSTIATNVPASSSRMPTWSGSRFASRSARSSSKALSKLSTGAQSNLPDVPLAEAAEYVQRRIHAVA